MATMLDSPKFQDPEKNVPLMPIALRWALIGSLTSIAVYMMFNLTGNEDSPLADITGLVVSIVVIGLGINELKNKYQGGFITMGRGFALGFRMTLIMSAISLVWTLVYFKFINPAALDEAQQKAVEGWEKAGMSEAQIEDTLEMSAFFFTIEFFVAFSFFAALIGGMIISLVMAAILQKKQPIN